MAKKMIIIIILRGLVGARRSPNHRGGRAQVLREGVEGRGEQGDVLRERALVQQLQPFEAQLVLGPEDAIRRLLLLLARCQKVAVQALPRHTIDLLQQRVSTRRPIPSRRSAELADRKNFARWLCRECSRICTYVPVPGIFLYELINGK